VSRNRRTAIAVRSIGVASAAVALALGVAGNAFACNIGDFSSSITCDQQSGKGSLVVHDTDGTRPVTITVKTDSGDQIAQQDFTDSGSDFTIAVPWTPGTHYVVLAAVKGRFDDQVVTKGTSTVPDEACGTQTTHTTPPTTATTTPPTTAPTTTPATTPSSTTSAPAVGDTNAPSPAAGGGQNLAETGGGSNTGMIAGIAAALVAVGGGAVFALRRRNPAARH